jgi:hypothetical protein
VSASCGLRHCGMAACIAATPLSAAARVIRVGRSFRRENGENVL